MNWLNKPGSGELMMQRRLEADLMSYIVLSSYERDDMIQKLHKRGIFTAPNGKPIEDFLVTSKPPYTPVSFGDEVKLSALPDDASTIPAPAMAAV